jgi:TfoX/Sxy family transcriptional regulator of competence genes
MTTSNDLLERVRRSVAGLAKAEEKRMFGGTAFMVNDKMCVTVNTRRMMCRIDPSSHEEAVKQKGVSTVVMKGREYVGWIYIDKSAIEREKQLTYWVEQAVEYNKKLVKDAKKQRA